MSFSAELETLVGVFEATAQNADALILVCDRDGKIEYANPAFCDSMGIKLDKALHQPIETIYSTKIGKEKIKAIQTSLTSDQVWKGELQYKNNADADLCCQTTVSPIKNSAGSFSHSVWVQIDISEQRELERKQHENQQKLSSILDNIPAYVFTKNQAGEYTYANKMLSMLHALHADNIIGKTDFDLFPGDAAKSFSKNDKHVFSRGKTVRAVEDAGVDEYGIKRSYLSVKCPLFNQDGEIEEMIGMSVDISEQQRLESALRASEEKLNDILDNIKARVYIKDKDLRYTYANHELCQYLSTDRINMIGKDDYDLFDTKTAISFRTTDEEVFKTGEKVSRMEISTDNKYKETQYFWSIKVPLVSKEGNVHSLLGISTDVTEQKRLEEALRRKEKQLTTILDNLKAHVYIKDVNFTYNYVNADLCDYLGRTHDDVVGKSDTEIFGETVASRFHLSDQQVFDYKENCTSIEKSKDYKTGDTRYFWSVKVPLVNELGNPYALLGISTDVTEQKRLEKELREMASTDVLTGVHNRRHFIELCTREISRAKRYNSPLSLIMLDMDHFKRINDSFGHAVGDEAIKAMTGLCRENLRDTDVIGRIGGEEFAIILPETDQVGALHIAERIRQSTAKYGFDIGQNQPCTFTASFGVTMMVEKDEEPDDLLKRADIALYDAKTLGRNRVCEG